jgi:hypothetical protein
MKKLFLILFISVMGISVMAQRSHLASVDETYWNVSLTAADTVSGTDAETWVYIINKHQPTTQSVTVTLDSLSAPGSSVQLKGKIFSGENYSNIGSAVTWSGTSSDTTFTISNSTANRYRYIALTVTGVGASQKHQVTNLEFKLWKE